MSDYVRPLLPGKMGVIRGCSPVVRGELEGVALVPAVMGSRVWVCWRVGLTSARLHPEPAASLSLDLSSPTGRVHAAWWLADRVLNIGGDSTVSWSPRTLGVGYGLIGEGDRKSFGPEGSGCDYELACLNDCPWEPEGAEALRRVCLYIWEQQQEGH